jgi:phosphoglycolate phosphatase
LKIGLATNDTEAPARAHLTAHGVLDLFDFVAGYDSGYGPKPGPGMCLAFARETGIDPARAVMVGDSTHDLIAGRAAGMRCVAVLTGIATAEELRPHADVVLRDIGGLGDWLDAIAKGA